MVPFMSLHLKVFSVLFLFISLLSAQDQDNKYYEEGIVLYDKLIKALSVIEVFVGESNEELEKNLQVVIDITVNNKLRQAIDSGFNSDLNDNFIYVKSNFK